jgi:hypothetical protein
MLELKYGMDKLVTHINQVKEGDIIAFFCEHRQQEIQAEVLGLLEPVVDNVIICRRLDEELADLVDIISTNVFNISGMNGDSFAKNLFPVCECGAKFTSNPKFHYNYCPISSSGSL